MPRLSAPLLSILLLSAAPYGAAAAPCKGEVGSKIGQCAPDFTLKTLDGKQARLSSYLGKVVFLNFWATWCAPCAAEIPEMDKANRQLQSSPFVMLAASIDSEGKPAVDKYFKQTFKGVYPSFTVLLDSDKKTAGRYGTFQVPETYIIDAEGRVRDKIEGVREWTDTLIIHYLQLLAAKR